MSAQNRHQWLGWIALAVFFWSGPGLLGQCAAAQRTERLTIEVGTLQRTCQLHLPSQYNGTTPLPLVLVFHGRFQGADDIAEITDFNSLADRYGFIAVYPMGIHHHWNDGRHDAPLWGARNYDDVGFIKTLLIHLEQTLAIDPTRIYATGMSNGAMFTHRLACELPGIFAAIGPVSGTLPTSIASRCTAAQSVSVVELHGTRDAYVHWDGGSVRALGGSTLSVTKTITQWQRVDHCPSLPDVVYASKRHPNDRTRVRRETYSHCQDGSEVTLYAIEGGGHTWPGGPSDHSIPLLGRVTSEISATEIIWAFFAEHTKLASVVTDLGALPQPQQIPPLLPAPAPTLRPSFPLRTFLELPFTLLLHPLFTTSNRGMEDALMNSAQEQQVVDEYGGG